MHLIPHQDFSNLRLHSVKGKVVNYFRSLSPHLRRRALLQIVSEVDTWMRWMLELWCSQNELPSYESDPMGILASEKWFHGRNWTKENWLCYNLTFYLYGVYSTPLNMASLSLEIKHVASNMWVSPPIPFFCFFLVFLPSLSIYLPFFPFTLVAFPYPMKHLFCFVLFVFWLKRKVDTFLRFLGFTNVSDNWKLSLGFDSYRKPSMDDSTSYW